MRNVILAFASAPAGALAGSARALLESTPAVLRTLLSRLPEPLVHVDEGPGTWSPFQVVCHLAHGEPDDWLPRIELILPKGASEPFRPFDREGGFVRYRGWPLQQGILRQ